MAWLLPLAAGMLVGWTAFQFGVWYGRRMERQARAGFSQLANEFERHRRETKEQDFRDWMGL